MSLRPALRPGAVLLRRDAHHLQVGTSPGFVLTDRPGLYPVIRLFDGVRDIARIEALAARTVPEFSGDIAAIVAELTSAGLVFDARAWNIAGGPALAAEARAANLSGDPPDRVSRRIGYRWSITGTAGTGEFTETVAGILGRCGFASPGDQRPDLTVMLSVGEPSRWRFEAAMEAGIDHLRVVLEEDHVRIGPLVRPGLTPCVNCHDLHRSDWDTAWPALMTQFGTVGAGTRPALEALTAHSAAVAVAAEVVAHCERTETVTAGHCLAIGPRHDARDSWPVTFHPDCSCTLLIAA